MAHALVEDRLGGRMMTKKIIQVGLGPWGTDWATTIIPRVPEVEVVGWVDSSSRMRDAFIAATNVAAGSVFADLSSAVAATGAVAVVAPVAIPAHEQVAEEVLSAGLHLLLEKPFTLDVASATRLVQLAASKSLVLAIDQNYRHFPGAPVVKGLLEEGAIGEVFQARVHWHRNHNGADSGGRSNSIVQLAIHHFDLMRYIFATNATAVTAMSLPAISGPNDPVTTLESLVELESGLVVSYSLSNRGAADQTPWPALWEIIGETGTLRWGTTVPLGNEPDHTSVTITDARGDVTVIDVDTSAPFERAGVLTEFAREIDGTGQPRSLGWDNVHSVAMLEACLASASGAGRVRVSRS